MRHTALRMSWMPGLLCSAVLTVARPTDCPAQGWLDRFQRSSQPKLQAVRAGRFLFVSDFEFEEAATAARELHGLQRQLQSELSLPPPEGLVRVYVFSTHDVFSRYVRKHIPYLTRIDMQRDGLFLLRGGVAHIFMVHSRTNRNPTRKRREPDGLADASGYDVGVSDTLLSSLRHEYVHVVLNSTIPDAPVWLDEGLAMYYELVEDRRRQNELISQLHEARRRSWRPDLAQLERIDRMQQMGPLEYAEAWSWVHLLMTETQQTRQLLSAYVQDLAAGRPQPDASQQNGVKADRPSFEEGLSRFLGDPADLWLARFVRRS